MNKVKIITTGPVPQRQTSGSAGYDVYAAETVVLHPMGIPQLVKLGFRMDMTQAGVSMLLMLRSSMSLKGVMLANGVGLIDQDFQGECCAILTYMKRWYSPLNPPDPFVINKGDRIGQLVPFHPVRVEFEPVESFDPTDRGERGFGSSGV